MIGYYLRRLLPILASLLLVVSLSAEVRSSADVESAGDLFDMSLMELGDLQIVSASKKEQHISEVAASAFVITAEDIHRYGYRTVGEALSKISGIYLTSDRSTEYLGVRGFSLSGDYNTKILVLVNGHRVNNDLYGMGKVDHALMVDVENIERIELVKGPGSALWGSNALFAVVNVITRQGREIDGGRLVAEVGSNQLTRGVFEYGRQLENGLDFAFSLSGLESDGEDVYIAELDFPALNNGVAEGCDGDRAYKGYLNLAYNDFDLHLNFAKRGKKVPTSAWGAAFNDDRYALGDGHQVVELAYEKELSGKDNSLFFGRIYYDRYGYDGDYPLTNYMNVDEGDIKQVGTELRYGLDASADLSLVAGFEYRDVYDVSITNKNVEPVAELRYVTAPEDDSFSNTGLYLQGEYDLLDNVLLIGGLRYDDYSTFGAQWSPRAALMYSPSLKTTLKLLYGEAFRAPNEFERNYELDTDYYAMCSNEALEPEEISTWELVVEHNLYGNIRLVTSIFRFEVEGLISQETVQLLPIAVLQFQNTTDTIRSEGLDIQVESDLGGGIKGYVNFSTSRTKNLVTETKLTNSPEYLLGAGVSVPVWAERFYVAPEIRVVDERSSFSGVDADAYFLANLSITSAKLFDNLELSLHVFNLFDEEYFAPGGDTEFNYDPNTFDYVYFNVPQEGRTFSFKAAYSF